MTNEEMREFEHLMKSYYQNKSTKLEQVNRVLWNIALDLVRAIADTELDGGGIKDVKKIGEAKTEELRNMLEREQAP